MSLVDSSSGFLPVMMTSSAECTAPLKASLCSRISALSPPWVARLAAVYCGAVAGHGLA